MLLNLVSNAIKFTPEGGRVSVAGRRVNGSVVIAVTDTGIGIAEEDRDRIFKEFQQAGFWPGPPAPGHRPGVGAYAALRGTARRPRRRAQHA